MEESTKKPLLLRIFTGPHRYVFGLIIFLFILAGALFTAWSVPGQLNATETNTALHSATISLMHPSVKTAVDLPYLLLQKASLHFFGITVLGIKLPSLLLGFMTGLGILWLLRCWLLRSSIALFSGVIAITSSQFLLVASSGTPLIMPLFWIVILLLLALKLSANHKSLLWSLAVGLALGLSLYTPLSMYLFLSLFLAIVLHPHLRYLLRTVPKRNAALSVLLFIVVLAPLAIALFKQPSIVALLVGWPDNGQTFGQIKFNIIELLKAYLYFWHPRLTEFGLTPIFGLGSFCLIIFGALKLFIDHHSARSYSLAVLLPVIAVPVLLQPQYAVILFVPFILLLAIGIEALLDEWYKLFPHNPYARVVALVPTMILLAGLVISNSSYYTGGYRYNADLPRYYSNDLTLARGLVQKHPDAFLVVSSIDKPFYDLLVRDFPKLKVTEQYPNGSDGSTQQAGAPARQTVIVSTNSAVPTQALDTPQQIINDSYSMNGPRFYLYNQR